VGERGREMMELIRELRFLLMKTAKGGRVKGLGAIANRHVLVGILMNAIAGIVDTTSTYN
jgi:hypothetical protein